MDSFFGIGLPELVLILVLAGLVMGPHRIHQIARIFGRVTAQLQRVSREFARQLNSELNAADSGEMKNTMNDMRTLQEEVEALRQELARVPRTFREVTDSVASEGKSALEASIKDQEGTEAVRSSQQPSESEAIETDSEDQTVSETQMPLPNPIDVPGDPES